MQRGPTGYLVAVSSVGGEECRAFVPRPLPPDPPLALDADLQQLHEEATLALGRLDGLARVLPVTNLFQYNYVRREAVLSSQIEGTQSSLSDLLTFESDGVPGVPIADVQEVSNYVAAMDYALERIQRLPVSIRLLREVHGVLLAKGRGSSKTPGELRRSQNWVGGTRPGNAVFVPPPPEHVVECLGSLEKFLHNDPVRTPLLIKAALSHVQFETIHPFLDGNGRLGRLLITLLLCSEGALSRPLLYLSLYLKQHRREYYHLLQQTRLTGDWESWLAFFFKGVRDTAGTAIQMAVSLLALVEKDAARIQQLGRAAGSAIRVHQSLEKNPLSSISRICETTGLSHITVAGAIRHLEALQIVREITGGRYGRLFVYDAYLAILSEGTEPSG